MDPSAREELLGARRGIAFETVFSAQDKIDFLQRAIAAGYFVRLFFIGTSDPRINAARVAGRVMAGGHTVPLEKIVSRYYKSIGNLSVAIRLADRVYVYDNSIDSVEAQLLARTREGALRKLYGPLAPMDRRRNRLLIEAPCVPGRNCGRHVELLETRPKRRNIG